MLVSFDILTFLFWVLISSVIPGAIISFSIFRDGRNKEDKDGKKGTWDDSEGNTGTGLNTLEKLLIGVAIGIVVLPLIPFLAYMIAGVKYSYVLAIFSVAVLYAIAIGLLIKKKAYGDLFTLPSKVVGGLKEKLGDFMADPKPLKLLWILSKGRLICAGLIIILILSYLVRIGTYGPVYQELDPYYYTYVAQQILTFGENPFNDQTAWYPDVQVNHRIIPEISYLESVWYSLYTSGGAYDNMLLATVASMYPPIAAVLAVFFIYLFVSAVGKREWGLIAAGIATFAPIFVYKLSAGEQEVQPYAFFALFFFYAMYTLAIKMKAGAKPKTEGVGPGAKANKGNWILEQAAGWFAADLRFPILAGIAFVAVALGSASQTVALSAVLIFVGLHTVILFLKGEDEELRHSIIVNTVVFVLGTVIGSALLKETFTNGRPSLFMIVPYLAVLAFAAALYLISQRFKLPKPAARAVGAGTGGPIDIMGMRTQILAGVLVIGILLFAFTPVGEAVQNVARSGFNIAKYNAPLDRTIAEQGVAAAELDGQIGPVATSFQTAPEIISGDGKASGIALNFVSWVLWAIFIIPSFVVNLILGVSVQALNFVLETGVTFEDKAYGALLFWIFLFWCAAGYTIYKAVVTVKTDEQAASAAKQGIVTEEQDDKDDKGHDNCNNNCNYSQYLPLLFVAVIMPPLLVGIIKAKYTIYAAVLLAAAIGFSAEPIIEILAKLAALCGLGAGSGGKDRIRKEIALAALTIGVVLVCLQFTYNGFSSSLALSSFQPLYQNNPMALQAKFQQFCSATNDSDVCAAAADPIGYASKGTNYQYSTKLCILSMVSDPSYLQSASSEQAAYERQVASFRCSRISEYWTDSMEWIRKNTEPNARITSWWDYGHWINYYGQRNAVLRNEHVSHEMIGQVAHGYLGGTPAELKEWMLAHDSEYAIFDKELVAGGGTLGGKYGALNYLACASDNDTNVNNKPGESQCEASQLWETIFVSNNPCTISELGNKTGWVAYKIYVNIYDVSPTGVVTLKGTQYVPYYPSECIDPKDQRYVAFCENAVRPVPAYCVGKATLANGQEAMTTYSLNETYPNGDLKLNKAILQLTYQAGNTYHFGQAIGTTLFYTKDKIWVENGEIKSGYEDRKGKFYDSPLYQALFLDNLPGFKLVYSTAETAVKIYKVDNGNDDSNN